MATAIGRKTEHHIQPSSVLSILAVNRFNELFLFHTVHYQGQYLFCTEAKLLGLSGGGPKADRYHIDPTTLFQDIEVQMPNWRELKGALTPEAVDTRQIAEQTLRCLKGNKESLYHL